MNRVALLLLLGGFASATLAQPQIRVLALFTDKAMLEIDGKRHLLKKGKASPEGVRLISANSREARLSLDGKEFVLSPQARISANYAQAARAEHRIVRDNSGHFRTAGRINGQATSFLVDTGATGVAISSVEADRLGLDFKKRGKPMLAQTASGVVKSYGMVLDRVSVGGIELRHVNGVVLEGTSPPQALLGMSFLGNLEVSHQGNLMLLRKR
ncbi:TIGR02281 family clan AA aspartic protease [Magnetovirga frankeli]|uniref:retropepsin-like aspartic protease family protein n=1 Tax=Magnetovirga frankeli TaxID=947516 RepID=UPI001293D488|nr:TIGR02281 family clan AA aspartic protease [gamma proteobacterium SS-5]